MFIFEDPSANCSERQKNLKKAQIKSHAASFAHNRRNYKLRLKIAYRSSITKSSTGTGSSGWRQSIPASDRDPTPSVRSGNAKLGYHSSHTTSTSRAKSNEINIIAPEDVAHAQGLALIQSPTVFDIDFNRAEKRAIEFFLKRTASEWSDWSDSSFWTDFVPKASYSVRALRHAMVSFAAQHESVETDEPLMRSKAKALATYHGKQAIELLGKDHDMFSLGTILLTHVVITFMACNLDEVTFIKAQNMEFELFDSIMEMLRKNSFSISRQDSHLVSNLLRPLIQRQRSKTGLYVDPIYCLASARASDFWPCKLPAIPLTFESIIQAHDVLEELLEYSAYIHKTEFVLHEHLLEEIEVTLELWKLTLTKSAVDWLLSRLERSFVSLLRCAAELGMMMILTMHARNEMIFDEYKDLFEDLADAFEESVQCRRDELKANTCFGMSPGLLALAGQAAMRWCREPQIRARLINTLMTAQRRDGFESSALWARIASCIRDVEEAGVHSPTATCEDIPAINRVIVKSVSFFELSLTIKLEILRDPWGSCRVDELLIPRGGLQHSAHESEHQTLKQALLKETAFISMGRGCASQLDRTTGRVFVVDSPRFFFPLPKA